MLRGRIPPADGEHLDALPQQELDHALVVTLAAEGAAADEALRGTGLAAAELRSPTTQVSVNQVIEVYRNALRISYAPHFAFNTGLKSHVSAYGMYGSAILEQHGFS